MIVAYNRVLKKYFRCLNRNCCTTLSMPRKLSTYTKPVLYGDEASPPVRFVMMTASILGIDFEFNRIDLFKAENKSDFYTKINPLQKVPALSVDGHVICDSHAIALYLCQKSLNRDLYPGDGLLKARVDQMLFFNASTLFPVDSLIFTDFFAGRWPANKRDIDLWCSSLTYLEHRLSEQQWLADDKMRLCDICCAATVSSLELILPRLEEFVHLKKWMKNLECFPFFDINRSGLQRLKSCIDIMKPHLF